MSDSVVEYRPVSVLAMVALAVGMVSALALVSQMAWALPIVGIGVAVAALADVRSGTGKTGRWAALGGLALSIGFAAQAVSSTLMTRSIAGERAVIVARSFVDALREDRLADAMSMSGPMMSMLATQKPRIKPGAAETDGGTREQFLELPVVVAATRCGAASSIVGIRPVPSVDYDRAWDVQVEIAPCAERSTGRVVLQVTVEPGSGALRRGTPERWAVTACTLAE